ncbi:PTS sugar transporter subunit IIA [Vagococcus sp. BWB3-3]|uniref:PTS sugar transporter subunit IIA n=1 Tax=Vagococcus allomyrinae TaxID=2794353 RepID=A0A940PE18_9ENTE|nr:PTS sugar transporter subunit IIA [Vagococcus allomyrinae]MBP1042258.1 PTS sugar transporter subunit IIA [Vagococcus allomyrinae]
MEIVLISHGELAKSMLESAQMIIGEQEKVVAFGLYPKDDINQLKEKLQQTFSQFEQGEEIVCLTDLFSGSPFNAAVSLMGDFPIYHMTGMNLALVLETLMTRAGGQSIEELRTKLPKQIPTMIVDVNKYLEQELTD